MQKLHEYVIISQLKQDMQKMNVQQAEVTLKFLLLKEDVSNQIKKWASSTPLKFDMSASISLKNGNSINELDANIDTFAKQISGFIAYLSERVDRYYTIISILNPDYQE